MSIQPAAVHGIQPVGEGVICVVHSERCGERIYTCERRQLTLAARTF